MNGLGQFFSLLVATILFLAPGWLVQRRWPAAVPLFAVIAGSIAFWTTTAFTMDAFRIAITPANVLRLWIAVLFVAWFGLRGLRNEDETGSRGSSWRPTQRDVPWIGCAAIALLSVLVRGWVDPMSGWDAAFRWDWMSQHLALTGEMRFYPPVQARDFEIYGWPDGIPPVASLISAWFYLTLGMTDASVTVSRLLLEALMIGAAVFHLARRLGGTNAGWPAVGMLGTSGLLLWGINMGQETGLLAALLVGLLALLPDRADLSAAGWAGIAAGLAGATREYGLAYVVLGLVLLLGRRVGFATIATYLITAGLICVPWYVRNAMMADNPFYPHGGIGGLTAPPAFAAVMAAIAEHWSWGHPEGSPLGWIQALVNGGGWVALMGLMAWRPRMAGLALGVALTTGLWLWSVSHTAGGHVYALRVLSPTVPLLAVMAAAGVGRVGRGLGRIIVGLTLLFAVDAARRSWLYPLNGGDPIWHYSWAPWQDVRDLDRITAPDTEVLHRLANGRLLVVDDMTLHRRLNAAAVRTTTIFDPRLTAAFATSDFTAAHQQLLAEGISLLVLSVSDRVQGTVYDRTMFFRELRERYAPNHIVDGREVYDLAGLTPQSP